MRNVAILSLVLTACAHAPPPAPAPPVAAPEVVVPPLTQKSLTTDSHNTRVDHDSWSLEAPGAWVIEMNDNDGMKAHTREDFGRGPILLFVNHQLLRGPISPEDFALLASNKIVQAVSSNEEKISATVQMPIEYNGKRGICTTVYGESNTIFMGLSMEHNDTEGYTLLCIVDGQNLVGYELSCGEGIRHGGILTYCSGGPATRVVHELT